MELDYSENEIAFKKELSPLDEFAIEFVSILNDLGIKYVVVSGYVAILFGRSRSSEDIDLLFEKLTFTRFQDLWLKLYEKFECLNTEDAKTAYEQYLLNNNAIRFSFKGEFLPNMEIKFPQDRIGELALNSRIKVILNGNLTYISPLELQISYKLFLGSEKDIEDARYLFRIFKDKLNLEKMHSFNRKLKIEEKYNKYIK
ncbi:hypothetical protein J4468_00975 [Candidatus Woesearchaeota archaeon]|nr:hypothetical protein [Candidatus Woesearchaeota archaeon]